MPMSKKNDPISVYLGSLWNFFASIQLTLVVLLSLAATSIIGTLIPQNEAPQQYLRAFGEFRFRLFSAFDLFDMYHSWWFRMLLILLAFNIVICSIDRLASTWKIIFPKDRHFNPARFRKFKNRTRFDSKQNLDELKPFYSKALSRSFSYLKLEDTPDGFLIFAEKGRWTRLGVYVVHLSVLLLLVGGLISSFFGFEAFVNIPEGESTDTVMIRGTGEHKKLSFTIRCDDFNLSLYPNGSPKEFRAGLTILENDQEVLKKDIIVNDPLQYDNINFYMSSYGELPPEAPVGPASGSIAPPSQIVLNFTSSESKMTYRRETAMGKKIDLPEGLGTFVLKDYSADAKFGGQEIGPALTGDLTESDGQTTEILLPLKFPSFDKMRRGKIIIAVAEHPEETFAPQKPSEVRYYAGIGVNKDPGVGVVYLGFILMILGSYIAFFASHQQICLEVKQSDGKQHVFLSGTSNKDKPGINRRVSRLKDKLSESAG